MIDRLAPSRSGENHFFVKLEAGASEFGWVTYFGIVWISCTEMIIDGWLSMGGWVMNGSCECAAVMLHLP